jgi:hypothetical protein
MAKQLYYYDNRTKSVLAVAPIAVEEYPSLDNIKRFLQHDMGVLSPLSIVTVDSNSFLDKLNVGEIDVSTITSAELDGGEF